MAQQQKLQQQKLLYKHQIPDSDGCIQHITPQCAGWHYVGFEVYQLMPGQTLALAASDNEICLVLIGGRATVRAAGHCFANIGSRLDPFERKKPYAVYISAGEGCQVSADSAVELAVCYAPGVVGEAVTRVISPPQIVGECRGEGNNRRYVHHILPETQAASSLLVVEVFTAAGCTSSYPSHKHDTDNPPHETYLEEVYYHRLHPAQGFCLQRVYTDDRSLDVAMAPYDKDVVLVPRGYHPVATIAGYDSYYLNVMAGPQRRWLFTWELDHRWINNPVPH